MLLFSLRQHRTIASASLSRLFAPLPQFRKWEIHTVFLHFRNFELEQKSCLRLLAELCGAALKSFLKILIGVQYERALPPCVPSPSSLRSDTSPKGRGKGCMERQFFAHIYQISRERSKKTEGVFLVGSRESEGKSKSPHQTANQRSVCGLERKK